MLKPRFHVLCGFDEIGLADIFAALLDSGAADAAVGAGAAGLAGAGAAGAFGGADATSASLDAGTAGINAGAGDATAMLPADTSAGLGTAAGGTTGATATLPEIDVTAQSLAPGTAGAAAEGGTTGIGGAGIASALAPALAGGAGGGGSVVAGATGASPEGVQGANIAQPADVAQPASLTGTEADFGGGGGLDSGGFLPATGDSSVSALSPDTMAQFGISPTAGTDTLGAGDVGNLNDFGTTNPGSWDSSTGSNAISSVENYFSSPKNDISAALMGLSLKSALSKPKLPGALGTAGANAGAATQGALSTIQSGGTATPEWAAQKSSIDATFNQQIKQQTEAIQQAAASSGEGTQNSGIVQQQIAQMTANVNTQRQQAYAQAQQQNVSAALSELSGGDATLTAIGNTQLQQSEQAQQLAAQTAEMALLLQTGQKIPNAANSLGTNV